MKILSFRYFEGPSVHCLTPVCEADVELEHLADCRTVEVEGLTDQLLELCPGLYGHYCSRGHAGGFVERLREGTYPGHVVEHVALELLAQAGEDVYWGKTRVITPSAVRIIFESEAGQSGRRALEEAMDGVGDLFQRVPCRLRDRLDAIRDELAQYRLGPSTRAIVEAARRRDIPVARVDDGSLVRLGQGAHQVQVRATLTSRTSAIAVDRAQSKAETKRVLRAAGLPVPEGVEVDTLETAQQVLEGWGRGAPLVVKPLDGHQGDGVSMNIKTPRDMERAFSHATRRRGPVLIEEQIVGDAYRLLVVGGQMVAAARRVPPTVIGDGQQTVRSLIASLNRDARRGGGHSFPMTRVALDDALQFQLDQLGIGLDEVLAEGRSIPLRASANLSTGATSIDVTDLVSPRLAQQAVRAARAMGLDIAGVDVVTASLSERLGDVGGAIVEVNAAPGLRMHEHPAVGAARKTGEAIVDDLFPRGQTGRIPVIAVTGTNGKTTVVRMIAQIFQDSGTTVGMATTDGIWVAGEPVVAGDLTGPWSARLILNDPSVEVAVLETARGGIARGGLGFDDCDVSVVTNIGLDHLGQDGIEDLDDLVHLKSLVVEVTRSQGAAVLNAEDPRVLGMARHTRAALVLFSHRPDSFLVKKHLQEGGRAVYVKHGALLYGHGQEETRLLTIRQLPAALGGIAQVNIANAAAAAAAALALNVPPKIVAHGLRSFPAGGQGLNQGRLEVIEGNDLTVLVDYGHNAPAVESLGLTCRGLKKTPIITVLGLPGDRRDRDLVATAQAAAAFSDQVVVREDADLRGRGAGELADVLASAVQAAGVPGEAVRIVLDEAEAVKTAIRDAPPGALVLVLFERYGVVKAAALQALDQRAETPPDADADWAQGTG